MRSRLYIQAGEAIRKLHATYKDLSTEERRLVPLLVYDEACSLALEGQPAAALGVATNPIAVGQTETFTATLRAPGLGTPSGTVSFTDGAEDGP